MITQEYLKSILDYDKDTGDFTWKVKKGSRALLGSPAGYLNIEGYVYIAIDKKSYLAHRLAWLYTTGSFPIAMIDHVNGLKSDNKLINLRAATMAQNALNKEITCHNTSGFKGVRLVKGSYRYRAVCTFNKKITHLGYFDTAEEASEAYKTFAELKHGEFYHV